MDNNKILSKSFIWLFIGLLVCFGVAYCTTRDSDTLFAVYASFGGYGYLVFAIAEIVLCIILSAAIHKMNPTIAKILYLVYTALTGLSLTGIFIAYAEIDITYAFLTAAIMFGLFALIGKTTKLDLSKIGTFLLIGLLCVIIISIVNVFVLNSALDLFTIIISLAIFLGYTAYDIYNISRLNSIFNNQDNAAIYFAFQLFLDFINIFIEILRLFGRHKD